jgi:hypothetical protein
VAFYSAQGHTRNAAEIVAAKLGADLFEIQPKQAYTEEDLDWTNFDSRVSREHEDEVLRDVELLQETPDGWEDYDAVVLMYPVWWGIAAWPVNRLVKINSFANKVVVPVAISHSSPLGESDKLLKAMSSTGDWRDGVRFLQSASKEELESWAEKLGL